MNARQLRLMRAAAVSSIATLIAALSHTFGGGSAPHPLLIVAVATLLTPAAALLVGATISRARVAVAVVVAQAAFHLLFHALGSPTGASPATGSSGHAHHLVLVPSAPVSSAAVSAAPDATMLIAHAVAAVLTTLVIWHGESILRSIARWVMSLFGRAELTVPFEHRPPRRARATHRPAFDAAVVCVVSRRGPPQLARG